MDKKAKIFWLWLPCVAGALTAVALRLFIIGDLVYLPMGAKSIPRDQIDVLNKESINVANYLLIDSIMSIVQSYYVDADRITPDHLLNLTVSALKENSRINADLDTTRQILTLQNGKHSKTIAIESPYGFEDFVEDMSRMAQFLDGQNPRGSKMTSSDVSPGAVEIVNNLLESLDAHSSLLDKDFYRELKQGTEGSFGGLGILVGTHESSLTVIRPIPGSPAEEAKLKRHDKILDIDGIDTFGQSLDELVEYMRGEPGTHVNLSVLRPGYYAPQTVKLSRRVINVNSVEPSLHLVKANNYLLNLKIDNFSARTTREILAAVNDAISKVGRKLKGISIDLRSNPGGLLDQAVEVADLFLDDGIIVSTRGRRTEVENAGRNYAQLDLPVFVLIDKESASASEIVAGALQDHDRAVVIGEPSFGKGSVQTVFELPADRALKLTIARYYTPSGRAIQNVGIYPDIWMQPVIQRHGNLNLFGKARYRNERFLAHRLESRSMPAAPMLMTPFRSYFLVDEKSEDAFSDFVEVDHDLEAAKIILRKVVDHYPMPIDEGVNRASHWIALASGEIGSYLKEQDAKVENWLATSFGIDWSPNKQTKTEPLLSFRVMKANLQAFKGSALQIPWKLTNTGNLQAKQVSIYLRSNLDGMGTKEILLGEINPHAAKSGVFQVRIPEDTQDEKIGFIVGAAINAMPLTKQSWTFAVNVNERERSNFEVDYDLVDENKVANGVLEPGEKARLKLYIRNKGTVASKPLDILVQSLAGRQVSLPPKSVSVDPVEPGSEIVQLIDVAAAHDIVSEHLKLGLTIQSSSMLEPMQKTLSVKTMRNRKVADSSLIAH